MDYNNTVLINGINPYKRDSWDGQNWDLAKYASKDSIKLMNNAVLSQQILKEKIPYNPMQYRVRIVGTIPAQTTDYKWYLYGKLRMTYKDSSVDEAYFTFLLGLNSWSAIMNLSAEITVRSSPEIMRMDFTLYTKDMAVGDVIYIQEVYLEPSISVDKSIEDAIQKSLPNMIIYSSSLDTTISTSAKNLAFITMSMANYANLSMHIFIQGTASADTNLVLKISMDNKELTYSPVTIPIKTGNFVVGLPLSLAQVATGSRSVSIDATLSNASATVTIPKNFFVVSIEGKNIEGGSNAEPPHAEVVQSVVFPNWQAIFSRRIQAIFSRQDMIAAIPTSATQTINKGFANALMNHIRVGNKDASLGPNISFKKVGDYIFFNLANSNKFIYNPIPVSIDDTGLQLITRSIDDIHIIPVAEGAMYSFELPDRNSYNSWTALDFAYNLFSVTYDINAAVKDFFILNSKYVGFFADGLTFATSSDIAMVTDESVGGEIAYSVTIDLTSDQDFYSLSFN